MIPSFFQPDTTSLGYLVDAPSFNYRGGKGRLRKFIIRWCKLSGSTYVEPFAGRANLFFLMRYIGQFNQWHLNDTQTIPFIRAVSDYDGRTLPTWSKEKAKKAIELGDPDTLLLEPLIMWAGGRIGSASVTGSRGHNLKAYRSNLLLAKRCLEDVKLSSRDALEVVEQYVNDPKAFIYLDPPYFKAALSTYSTSSVDFKGLWKMLRRAKCSWLYSEMNRTFITKQLGEPLTAYYGVSINANPKAEVRLVVEYLWANYSTIPTKMNFHHTGRNPMKISHQLLREWAPVSFSGWLRLVPRHWCQATIKAQYDKLGDYPDYYFDGRVLSVCNGEKE